MPAHFYATPTGATISCPDTDDGVVSVTDEYGKAVLQFEHEDPHAAAQAIQLLISNTYTQGFFSGRDEERMEKP